MLPFSSHRLLPLVAVVFLGGSPAPSEVSRIRRHLAGAETVLARRDESTLSASQLANRHRVKELLAEYRRAGRFPINEDFAERRVPYFRDRRGTLCAMAFLLERTGYAEIVNRVAATRNNAYVRELAGEPGLAEWLDRFGLTVAEAARIQPAYGGPPWEPYVDPSKITPGYAVASAVGLGLSVTATALNLAGPRSRQRLAWLGAGAGLVTAMLGAGKVDNGGSVRGLGITNVVIGGIAALVGIQGLVDRSQTNADDGRQIRNQLDVGVMVGPGGAPGLQATLRF